MATTADIHNWEIVMLALQALGAEARRVHTEDVTLQCFQLAPDRFSWFKYTKFPDKEVVRKDLTRLRDGQYGATLVRGRTGLTRRKSDGIASTDGWQLTEEGISWLHQNESRLACALKKRPLKTTRQEQLKSLDRVRQHPLFIRYQSDPTSFGPTLGELAELLRCKVDSDDNIWTSRFRSFKNSALASNQPVLVTFLEQCEMIWPRLDA